MFKIALIFMGIILILSMTWIITLQMNKKSNIINKKLFFKMNGKRINIELELDNEEKKHPHS